MKHLCPVRFGVENTAVETSDLKAVEKLLQKEGPFDMIFLETPANPILSQTDIAAISELARKYGEDKTLVAVDNTFLGPVFQSPFELGADLVLYSATKFLGGHSDIIAGAALSRVAELITYEWGPVTLCLEKQAACASSEGDRMMSMFPHRSTSVSSS